MIKVYKKSRGNALSWVIGFDTIDEYQNIVKRLKLDPRKTEEKLGQRGICDDFITDISTDGVGIYRVFWQDGSRFRYVQQEYMFLPVVDGCNVPYWEAPRFKDVEKMFRTYLAWLEEKDDKDL